MHEKHRTLRRSIRRVLIWIGLTYVAWCLLLYFVQDAMMFPIRLLDAPAGPWRADFTRVSLSRVVKQYTGKGDAFEYGLTARRSNTLLSTGDADILELDLVCIADGAAESASRIVDDAHTLLDIIATALGRTQRGIRVRLADDWERYDRQHL